MITSLPPDTISHVLTKDGKPMSKELREALITMVEVAYAAAKKGILPDESCFPSNHNGQ